MALDHRTDLMKLGEFLAATRGMGHDVELRIGSIGHRCHTEYEVEQLVVHEHPDEHPKAQKGDTVTELYLIEGTQLGYLPEEVREKADKS